MYNILIAIISFITPIFILKKEIKGEKNINNFITKNKIVIITYFIFVIGFLTRILFIEYIPNALNVDEASSGYEAYSILNYGIDRNGNFLPVFLESWGSGQNALYTYILIPFIKILGLTVFSVRLPMAIIGCISLIVIYKILKQTTNQKDTIIGLAIFAICPWHIMKSRWGLESNIFPDLVLYSTYFIIKYLKTNKINNIYISAAILGICSYAYGTAYFFLPIFVILLLIYLYKKGLPIKHCIGMLVTIFIISLPIILFVIINTFNLEPIKFIFTIPILEENRYKELSSIFGKNFLQNSVQNFIKSCKMLITQNDELPWNTILPYGIIYIISLPLTFFGIYKNFKEKNKEKYIFNIWFIVGILLMFVVEPNINRLNIIIIPIIYYTIIGICTILEKIILSKIFLPIIYISLFMSFIITYIGIDFNNYITFNGNIKNVIKYVNNNLEVDKIYIEYAFKEPYIYICFYNKVNTKEFVNTVKYKNNIKSFESVESFGKYYFYLPNNINEEENVAYVIKNYQDIELDDNIWDKKYIYNFIVLTKK